VGKMIEYLESEIVESGNRMHRELLNCDCKHRCPCGELQRGKKIAFELVIVEFLKHNIPQEELGAEFSKVLFDNLREVYEK